MSYFITDPTVFRQDMITGFAEAHSDLVEAVDGGVVRVMPTPPDQVAVVIGGGSGHYPAFAGLVGLGLAHGAAMGDVFASPSAQQVYSVARSCAGDAGVLLTYGNYAGDRLNFDAAQQRLNAEGITTRTVLVTDDISSAAEDQRNDRRGVAGDLAVFRAAGWAAAQNRGLDDVVALAARANSRTRTLGVAFSGCTLPGGAAPLFGVPIGRMAVGMGIHGEPGIGEQDLPSPEDLAHLLVSRVLAEQAAGSSDPGRVAVIVNGLGAVKGEELYLLFGKIASRLRDAGAVLVAPEVGEFATSFDMAGVSLTLMWLDDELEQAWTSSVVTPAMRRGDATTTRADSRREHRPPRTREVPAATTIAATTASSRAAAQVIRTALEAVRDTIGAHVDELGRLDSVAGDGDHGIGMIRGAEAAVAAAQEAYSQGAGPATVLGLAADAWAARAGGTSGALWGLGLRAVADRLDDMAVPSQTDLVAGMNDAVDAIAQAGGAGEGDKTVLDALIPFAKALRSAAVDGRSVGDSWRTAALAATQAADATQALVARRGRARSHSARSIGTPDPGAVSFAFAMTAVGEVLAKDGADESASRR